MADEDMGKKVVENFNSYCQAVEMAAEMTCEDKAQFAIQPDHFYIYKELMQVYHKKGDDIFY